MVFEESTFVLPKAAAKVAPEPFEPAVQDPRAKPKTVEAAVPAATVKAPKKEPLQPAPEKPAAPAKTLETIVKLESNKVVQQATPKREPKRPQWDTSKVNKARNAPRKAHQPQWSPGGAAPRTITHARSPARVSPAQNSAPDSQRSPAKVGGQPLKHPSEWTLEGESVLDRLPEGDGFAAEEARKDSDEDEALRKPTRTELRAEALEKGWVGNGTGTQIGLVDEPEDGNASGDLKKLSPAPRFGIEGIMRTFTGEGSQGMAGQGKPPGGLPNISCRAGAAEEDGGNAKNAVRGRKGRNSAKSSCMGCSVM